tara:strand:- start:713 stop:883 length:171 start_codon:yes stop_codon:yes gene_type:complete
MKYLDENTIEVHNKYKKKYFLKDMLDFITIKIYNFMFKKKETLSGFLNRLPEIEVK